jgi:hypothetical protein
MSWIFILAENWVTGGWRRGNRRSRHVSILNRNEETINEDFMKRYSGRIIDGPSKSFMAISFNPRSQYSRFVQSCIQPRICDHERSRTELVEMTVGT